MVAHRTTSIMAHSSIVVIILVLYTCGQQQRLVAHAMNSNQDKLSGPRLVIFPSELSISTDVKDPITPECKTEGADPQLFSILRWSGPMQTGRTADQLQVRHKVEEMDQNQWSLQFINPTHEDSGMYTCEGKYQQNDALFSHINITFQVPLEVSQCPEKQFLIQGENTGKISCQIKGDSARVTVTKDGKPVLGNRYRWDNENNAISINGVVNASDAGTYMLRIRSFKIGKLRDKTIVVSVHSKPEIITTNNDYQFYGVEGEQAELECKTTGNPKPIVHWQDPSKRNLSFVGGYHVAPEKGTLIISKIDRRWDQGQFVCTAFNDVGSDSRNISMGVNTRPRIVNFDNKTVEEGAEVTFECRSTGEPEPKFSIRRQGNGQLPYMNGDGHFRREEVILEEGGSNVYIHRLTIVADRSHYGLHYCNATNRAGTAEQYNHLFVKYKPDLNLTSPIQYVKMGKEIAVNCIIKAFPAPRVTWLSDRTQMINFDTKFTTSSDNQVHTITMTPPSQQQVAFTTFTCRAENDMGFESKEIRAQYTTSPGVVTATLAKTTPTTVELVLFVPNDGGDRIKKFIYRLEGKTLDLHNPFYQYKPDIKQDAELVASFKGTDMYTIKNLRPYHSYRMYIRAVNDAGDGHETEVHFETMKPTGPEPPIIIKPDNALSQHSTPGYHTEFSNGYDLRWSPPELDNGDIITKYIVKYFKYDPVTSGSIPDDGRQKIIEQMSERPMKATLGPLEPGHRYKIELRATNNFGESDPAHIIIYTKPGAQPMANFESRKLPWLLEPPYAAMIALLLLGFVLAIIVDLTFCIAYQMGLSYKIRYWCCPPKETKVISDKHTSAQ